MNEKKPHLFSRARTYILKHKILSGLALVIVLGIGWWAYGAYAKSQAAQPRYVLGTVEKGTITSSITGSGQVSADDTIDIKPKASGDITWVGVAVGDHVSAGQALASIDSTDQQRSIADAQNSLQTSQLQLQQDTAQAPINYQKTVEARDTANKNLAKEYDSAYAAVSNAYINLPGNVTGIYNLLYETRLSPSSGQWNVDVYRNFFTSADDQIYIDQFADAAEAHYKTARAAYDADIAHFKSLPANASTSTIEEALEDTLADVKDLAQAAKDESNLIDAVVDTANRENKNIPSQILTYQTNANTYVTGINNILSSLLSESSSLDNAKQSAVNAQRDLDLAAIGNPGGDNPVSLQISRNSLDKQEQDLADLKADLANYTIRSPFDGVVASVGIKRGDSASSGSAAFTVITNKKIATLSLNEVDAAKVKTGQRATLTFDAIEGLTLTGEVAQIDPLGTVSQGVVSYAIEIAFDTQDARIKPGMTVNATISTDSKQDILVVPSSAVKTANGVSYVQVFTPPLTETGSAQGVTSATPPQQVEVQTGISDDTNVEIISGLAEGQQIVTRTITSSTGAAATGAAGARTTGGATRTGGFGGGGAIRL